MNFKCRNPQKWVMTVYDAVLRSKTKMTGDVSLFRFELDQELEFEPGDHVELRLENEDRKISRPYNIVSLNHGTQVIFAIRRYEEGEFSPIVHDLEEGDDAEITEPGGNLNIASYEKDAVFISTGTGATPMFDMLKDYLENGSGKAFYFYGEKTKEDIIFREELEILKAENPELDIIYSLSDEDWDGKTGHIQNYVPRELESMDDKVFYICGVPAMVVQTESLLKGAGVDEENIVTEGWEEGQVD